MPSALNKANKPPYGPRMGVTIVKERNYIWCRKLKAFGNRLFVIDSEWCVEVYPKGMVYGGDYLWAGVPDWGI